jgi:hypothetical protein
VLQKPSPQPFSDEYCWILFSPALQRNLLESAISAKAEDALLNAFRQREQWQALALISVLSISYWTVPQKHSPLII